jgi:hypothetical protein
VSGEFRGLRAKRYEFREHDGTSRPVIALYAGAKPMGFIEYGTTARRFVDQVHDLCDEHDRALREAGS